MFTKKIKTNSINLAKWNFFDLNNDNIINLILDKIAGKTPYFI
tara:strand:- start:386 stop:514 length:129 start_codon:yes stop_codon:yes gene_type:complete